MNNLKSGFSRIDVTPMLGIELYGYYNTREANGVLDPLEINTIALDDGTTRALLISVDNCGIIRPFIADFQREISRVTGIPTDAIYIHATHTHTGPYLVDRDNPAIEGVLSNIINTNPSDEQKNIQTEYYHYFRHKIVDSAVFALEDLKPSTVSYGRGTAPGIGFIRRYRMKDGSAKTNPPPKHPDVVGPIGKPDDEICIIKFARENAEDILFVNYGNHPDTLSTPYTKKFSAQWCGFTRQVLERAIPNTKCAFFNGTMGDVNHINRDSPEYYAKDRLEHSYYMGQVVAGGVLQSIGYLKTLEDDTLRVGQKIVNAPSHMPEDGDNMEIAHKVNDLHNTGRDKEIDIATMMTVPNAARLVRLEHGPAAFEMTLSAVAIGSIALIGIPGQLFACSGFDLKAIDGYDMIVPTSQTNGSEGYFPPMSAYTEGSYETSASNFKAGVAELLVSESAELLASL